MPEITTKELVEKIIDFVKEWWIKTYKDLYEKLVPNNLNEDDEDKLKFKIRRVSRKLKDKWIIEFERWWKNFVYIGDDEQIDDKVIEEIDKNLFR